MNLDELRSAQAKERRKDSLQHLRDSFYDDVAAYVADLRAARDRRAEQVDKPFSDDDVRRMSDEVETAEEVAEALYERRVGKVVKLASFAAADMPVDADGMTTEERQLFDDLVDRIGENKSRVLDVLAGETAGDAPSVLDNGESVDAGEAADAVDVADPDVVGEDAMGEDVVGEDAMDEDAMDEDVRGARAEGGADALTGAMGGSDEAVADALDATTDGGSRAADAPAGRTGPTGVDASIEPPSVDVNDDQTASDDGAGDDRTPADESSDDPSADRATVKITRDVGAIFGVDEREYDLVSEDVVTLPAENAAPLVQRDAAERLD